MLASTAHIMRGRWHSQTAIYGRDGPAACPRSSASAGACTVRAIAVTEPQHIAWGSELPDGARLGKWPPTGRREGAGGRLNRGCG
eukprot:361840-Chlamydomonas_euryale.AAC.17